VKREEEELFKYDSGLKLEDINGTADRKILSIIKTSIHYKKGLATGLGIKKDPKAETNKTKEGKMGETAKIIKNGREINPKTRLTEKVKEDDEDRDESSPSKGSKSDSMDSNESQSSSQSSNSSSEAKKVPSLPMNEEDKRPDDNLISIKEGNSARIVVHPRKNSTKSIEENQIKRSLERIPVKAETRQNNFLVPGLGLGMVGSSLAAPKPPERPKELGAGGFSLLMPPTAKK